MNIKQLIGNPVISKEEEVVNNLQQEGKNICFIYTFAPDERLLEEGIKNPFFPLMDEIEKELAFCNMKVNKFAKKNLDVLFSSCVQEVVLNQLDQKKGLLAAGSVGKVSGMIYNGKTDHYTYILTINFIEVQMVKENMFDPNSMTTVAIIDIPMNLNGAIAYAGCTAILPNILQRFFTI